MPRLPLLTTPASFLYVFHCPYFLYFLLLSIFCSFSAHDLSLLNCSSVCTFMPHLQLSLYSSCSPSSRILVSLLSVLFHFIFVCPSSCSAPAPALNLPLNLFSLYFLQLFSFPSLTFLYSPAFFVLLFLFDCFGPSSQLSLFFNFFFSLPLSPAFPPLPLCLICVSFFIFFPHVLELILNIALPWLLLLFPSSASFSFPASPFLYFAL